MVVGADLRHVALAECGRLQGRRHYARQGSYSPRNHAYVPARQPVHSPSRKTAPSHAPPTHVAFAWVLLRAVFLDGPPAAGGLLRLLLPLGGVLPCFYPHTARPKAQHHHGYAGIAACGI